MGLLDDAIREHLDLKRRRGGDPAEIEKLEREALGPVRRDPTAFADGGPVATGSTGLADAPADYDDAPSAYAEAPVDAGAIADFALHPDDFAATELHAPVSDPHTDPLDEDPLVGTDPLEDEPFAEAPHTSEREAPTRGGIASPDYADPEFDEFAAERGGRGHRHRFGFLHRRHHHERDPESRPPVPIEVPEDDPLLPPAPAPEADSLSGAAEPPMLRITPEANLGETVEYDVERAFAEEARRRGPEAPAGSPEVEEDPLEETPEFLADTPDHDRLWFEQKPPPDFDFE